MPLPRRPASLLLLALMGASAVAVAGPVAAGPHQDQSEARRDREALRDALEAAGRNGALERPAPLAERPEPRQFPRPERRARQEDALSDSVRRIERRTRGQVLSAERVPYEGRDLNRIKVIDEHGRVRVFMDDPTRPPTRGDDD